MMTEISIGTNEDYVFLTQKHGIHMTTLMYFKLHLDFITTVNNTQKPCSDGGNLATRGGNLR